MTGIYKYVEADGRIIYIGKSDKSIEARIRAHKSGNGADEKFRKYPDAKIYVMELPSPAHTVAAEAMLIEKYKPELNVALKSPVKMLFDIEPLLPQWCEYSGSKSDDEAFSQLCNEEIFLTKMTPEERRGYERAIRLVEHSDKVLVSRQGKGALIKWHHLEYYGLSPTSRDREVFIYYKPYAITSAFYEEDLIPITKPCTEATYDIITSWGEMLRTCPSAFEEFRMMIEQMIFSGETETKYANLQLPKFPGLFFLDQAHEQLYPMSFTATKKGITTLTLYGDRRTKENVVITPEKALEQMCRLLGKTRP